MMRCEAQHDVAKTPLGDDKELALAAAMRVLSSYAGVVPQSVIMLM
jgi:hypothetical protein